MKLFPRNSPLCPSISLYDPWVPITKSTLYKNPNPHLRTQIDITIPRVWRSAAACLTHQRIPTTKYRPAAPARHTSARPGPWRGRRQTSWSTPTHTCFSLTCRWWSPATLRFRWSTIVDNVFLISGKRKREEEKQLRLRLVDDTQYFSLVASTIWIILA